MILKNSPGVDHLKIGAMIMKKKTAVDHLKIGVMIMKLVKLTEQIHVDKGPHEFHVGDASHWDDKLEGEGNTPKGKSARLKAQVKFNHFVQKLEFAATKPSARGIDLYTMIID
jgi:hypothetical protein